MNTLYSCQALIHSLFTDIFSEKIGPLLIASAFFILLHTLIQVFYGYYKIFQLKRNFIHNNFLTKRYKSLLIKHHLYTKVFFLETTQIFAFCFGFYKPKIYISTGLLEMITNQELEAILVHEKYHMEHRDSLTITLIYLLQRLLPFFPFLKDLSRSYKTVCEINADNAAITQLQDNHPLISVLRKMIHASAFNSLAVASFANESLESRVKMITRKEPYRATITIKNLSISVFSLFLLATIAITPSNTSAVCVERANVYVSSLNASYPYSATQQPH